MASTKIGEGKFTCSGCRYHYLLIQRSEEHPKLCKKCAKKLADQGVKLTLEGKVAIPCPTKGCEHERVISISYRFGTNFKAETPCKKCIEKKLAGARKIQFASLNAQRRGRRVKGWVDVECEKGTIAKCSKCGDKKFCIQAVASGEY